MQFSIQDIKSTNHKLRNQYSINSPNHFSLESNSNILIWAINLWHVSNKRWNIKSSHTEFFWISIDPGIHLFVMQSERVSLSVLFRTGLYFISLWMHWDVYQPILLCLVLSSGNTSKRVIYILTITFNTNTITITNTMGN